MAEQTSHGQFAPILIIDQLLKEDDDEGDGAFVLVAWGGGPVHLLAAATRQHLYIFSLRNFLLGRACSGDADAADASASSAGRPPAVPLPSISGYHLVSRSRLEHPALTMDWTHAGCGLLLADEAHRVVMLRLTVSGLDSQHVARGGLPDVQLSEAWSVRSDTPHVLAAAGLDTMHPCATAPRPPPDKSSQHRVTIWWPQQPAAAASTAVAAAAAVPSSNSGKPAPSAPATAHKGTPQTAVSGRLTSVSPATPISAPHTAAQSSVGAEVIRHPVKVLSMQWSPALALAPAPPAAAAAVVATVPAASSSTAQRPQPPPQAPPAPDPSPGLALMTVGADWSVRIYVEVVMRDLFPAAGPGGNTAPGSTMSQYCLTLVIEPPVQGLSPGLLPGLRACWAKPLLHHDCQQPHDGGNMHQHWSGRAGGGGWAGGAPALMEGGEAEALMSSKVHWVVASIAVPGEQAGAGPSGKGAERGL